MYCDGPGRLSGAGQFDLTTCLQDLLEVTHTCVREMEARPFGV